MTDRINALTITLTKDIRIDNAQSIINAILMIKGVLRVDTHVSNMEDHIAYSRAC
jgi:hypothetical protein